MHRIIESNRIVHCWIVIESNREAGNDAHPSQLGTYLLKSILQCSLETLASWMRISQSGFLEDKTTKLTLVSHNYQLSGLVGSVHPEFKPRSSHTRLFKTGTHSLSSMLDSWHSASRVGWLGVVIQLLKCWTRNVDYSKANFALWSM